MGGLLFGFQKACLFRQDTFESIEFDASVSETHSFTTQATEHPVEDGIDITDHIRVGPDELQVNVIMTNDPPILLASLRALPISGFGDSSTRAEDTVTFLKGLMVDAVLVTFDTTLRSIQNAHIKSMSVVRDATNGNIANINLLLREVQFSTTAQSTVPIPISPRDVSGNANGASTPTAASAPVAEKAVSKSLLVSGAELVQSLLPVP